MTALSVKEICGRRHSKTDYLFQEKIRFLIYCESSVRQTTNVKCHALFSPNKKREYFKVSSAVVVINACFLMFEQLE